MMILRCALVACAMLVFIAETGHSQSDNRLCTTATGADRDGDGLADSCELELATRFAPLMTFSHGACNLKSSHRPLGGYLFAVEPVDAVIRIAYMPGYVEDCGWTGLKCRIPGVDCSPHAGDSEFIVVELEINASRNSRVSGVFLSAHCFGRSRGDCRWYRGMELTAFKWHGEAPVVWVAKGRNANYPSARACDAGHHFLDSCDDAVVQSRFPIDADRNIGSRKAPMTERGCVSAKQIGLTGVEPAALECMWDANARFRGWQPDAAGVTGYFRYLTEIAGF